MTQPPAADADADAAMSCFQAAAGVGLSGGLAVLCVTQTRQ
ncbi:MAG: hypothetical protein Q8R06_19505 [Polaromonas sp.]|nr:hypothetical protein [Polaromonas sp.]MDP3799296.1 hypothetical protein [Polaromonas sp.]